MANVGDVLKQPESGWSRIDSTDPLITATTGSATTENNSVYYGGSAIYTGNNDGFTFYFRGTQIRIIDSFHSNRGYQDLFIDGEEKATVQAYSYTPKYQVLMFDVTGLEDKIHKVEFKKRTGNYMGIDAIDVNTGGFLVSKDDYDQQGQGNISQKNANLVYTLPMATTNRILAKTGDSRTGLLGLANDDANFGDLYVVGYDGKAHLTKCGIKKDIIFDGSKVNGALATSKKIDLFKYLVVESQDNLNNIVSEIISVKTLNKSANISISNNVGNMVINKSGESELTIVSANNLTLKTVSGIY